jgi:hypothetical protein
MTLSTRSLMRLAHLKAPETDISRDAITLLKLHLERVAEAILSHASSIHDRENAMRQSVGERPKVRLSPKHIKMAIDGKFAGENDEL